MHWSFQVPQWYNHSRSRFATFQVSYTLISWYQDIFDWMSQSRASPITSNSPNYKGHNARIIDPWPYIRWHRRDEFLITAICCACNGPDFGTSIFYRKNKQRFAFGAWSRLNRISIVCVCLVIPSAIIPGLSRTRVPSTCNLAYIASRNHATLQEKTRGRGWKLS